MDDVIIGRLLLLVLTLIFSFGGAFKFTPELDDVKSAWIYRISVAMLIARGLAYIWFDIFNLFPLTQ